MAAASTASTIAYLFKTVYQDGLGDAASRERPFMSMLPRKQNMGRTGLVYAVRYGNPQGGSTTVTDSRTAISGSDGAQFTAAVRRRYHHISLDGLLLLASSESDLVDALTEETDASMEEFGDRYSFDLFGNGTAIRGRRSSISTNTVTLTAPGDAYNFKPGMTVRASANADGSSPRTGSTTVSAVNLSGGTVTLTSAAAITSFADNDYLFALGEASTVIDGLASIIPLTAPVLSSDSFRGVDRGVYPELLAGSRLDDTGTPPHEAAGLVARDIRRVGKRATHVLLNPTAFHDTSRRLDAKIEYSGGGEMVTTGFETFMIATPAGTLKAVSDPNCPANRGYVINLETWYISSVGDVPHVASDDGRPSIRLTDDDGVEIRTRAYSNLICTNPAKNGVFSIA